MTADGWCPTEAELAEALGLAADDPRHVHLDGCPRCRARLAEYRAFLAAPAGVPGDDATDAERRLLAFIVREIAPVASAAPPAIPSPLARLRAWWGSPAAAPALALAAVAVVAGGVALVALTRGPLGRSAPDVLRGESAEALAPLSTVPGTDGALVLRWAALSGADAYELALHSGDLVEVARIGPLTGTSHALAPGALAGVARGDTLLWRVRALAAGAALAESEVGTLIAP
jgi:hypothetical protein